MSLSVFVPRFSDVRINPNQLYFIDQRIFDSTVSKCKVRNRRMTRKKNRMLDNLKFFIIRGLVSEYFEIEPSVIDIKTRKRIVIVPRAMIYFLTRKLTSLSYAKMGSYSNQHYSTVLVAVRKMGEDIDIYVNVKNLVLEIEKRAFSVFKTLNFPTFDIS